MEDWRERGGFSPIRFRKLLLNSSIQRLQQIKIAVDKSGLDDKLNPEQR